MAIADPETLPHEAMPEFSIAQLTQRSLGNLKKCWHWAWLDTVCQYRRSRIGPLWETINILVMVVGITLVSSAVIGGNALNLAPYIGLGIVIWSFITSTIIEGASTFIRNGGYITSTNLSVDLYAGRTLMKSIINFGHHIILYFVGLLLLPIDFGWTALLVIPGLFLLFINAYWVIILFAFLCSRFRDVEMILRNLLQLAFFVTPIFWDAANIRSDRKFIVDYNVLYYYIEIVRSPLLGRVPPLSHYITVMVATVIGFAIAYVVYRKMRRQLAFFV
jgi:ABC-type polysaccharide/polyol phosphate export permease